MSLPGTWVAIFLYHLGLLGCDGRQSEIRAASIDQADRLDDRQRPELAICIIAKLRPEELRLSAIDADAIVEISDLGIRNPAHRIGHELEKGRLELDVPIRMPYQERQSQDCLQADLRNGREAPLSAQSLQFLKMMLIDRLEPKIQNEVVPVADERRPSHLIAVQHPQYPIRQDSIHNQ